MVNGGNSQLNYSIPYTASFIENGTWRLRANYPVARNAAETAQGTWTITTLIFSKSLSKQFGQMIIPMATTNTGAATLPVID